MSYIRIYDRAESGLDMGDINNGQFFFESSGEPAQFTGLSWYDWDTYVLSYLDRGSDASYRYSVFVRDVLGGSVIESVYYSDRGGRSTLDMYGIEVFVSDSDLNSVSTSWFVDMFNGRDTIIGNRYRDLIKGGSSGDTLEGRGGSDQIFGERGDDSLFGGSGSDRLYGGPNDDYLHGGSGKDRLFGGSGFDTFIFSSATDAGRGSSRDEIHDFDIRYDWIDISDMDANVERRGDQAYEFIGRLSFSGDAGEVRFRNETLSGDTDGDGHADFEIWVLNVNSLREIDLYL